MRQPPSQSYLLRLWREHPEASLRATLISISQPEVHQHFADLEALCAFLRARTDAEVLISDTADHLYCTPSTNT